MFRVFILKHSLKTKQKLNCDIFEQYLFLCQKCVLNSPRGEKKCKNLIHSIIQRIIRRIGHSYIKKVYSIFWIIRINRIGIIRIAVYSQNNRHFVEISHEIAYKCTNSLNNKFLVFTSHSKNYLYQKILICSVIKSNLSTGSLFNCSKLKKFF